ncbi:MAG: DUF1571 domain-containing protein [Aeoliella sp.]
MIFRPVLSRLSGIVLGTIVLVGALLAQVVSAQELSEPVYRVAKDTPAQAASVSTPLAAATEDFFDLTQKEGEHPLAPCKRMAERALKEIDANIQDYSCDFTKRERIDGKLLATNHIYMQTLHEPFGVYLLFKKPKKGQECLYVDGENDNRLAARPHGWRGSVVGILNIDPNGSRAMDGQLYPITKIGIRNLTEEIIKIAENDLQYGECNVKHFPDVKIDNRPALMVEATHPVRRNEFRFHVARIYIDREYRVPVAFQAYSWPKEKGDKPVLEEQYIYTNLKLNNGYTANDFSTDNPAFFK